MIPRLLPIAAVILAAALSGPAMAETPGPDWLTQEQITKKLTDAGYSHVTSLEADAGHWEGKGLKDGKLTAFKADPRTGAIVKEDLED